MIYACRIKSGKVSFSNRYVDTNRLRQEKAAGHPLGLKVICMHLSLQIPDPRSQIHPQGKLEQAPGSLTDTKGGMLSVK